MDQDSEPGQAPFLKLGQFRIEASLCAQLKMGPLLDEPPPTQDEDAVRRLHGGETMGDHNSGPALQQPVEIPLQRCFG